LTGTPKAKGVNLYDPRTHSTGQTISFGRPVSFDTHFQTGVTSEQLDTLKKLEWVDQAFNLVLIGPPGTGKTHIALAIANKAVTDGYKVG